MIAVINLSLNFNKVCQFFNSLQSIFAEVVMSPPFVFIPYVKSELRSEFQVAAQNCWVKKGGAFTGEIRYVFNPNFLSIFNTFIMNFFHMISSHF